MHIVTSAKTIIFKQQHQSKNLKYIDKSGFIYSLIFQEGHIGPIIISF